MNIRIAWVFITIPKRLYISVESYILYGSKKSVNPEVMPRHDPLVKTAVIVHRLSMKR